MKRTAVALLVVAFTGVVGAQMGGGDEKSIRDLLQSFGTDWGKADAAMISQRWTSDGDMVVSDGSMAKGPAEIQKWFEAQFAGPYKGTKMSVTVVNVRLLKPDVAMANGDWQISGIRGSDGKEGSRAGKVTAILLKDGGAWKVAAWRSMVPSRPGAVAKT